MLKALACFALLMSVDHVSGKKNSLKCRSKAEKLVKCEGAPKLACQMKDQNNNVLSCSMSSAPKVGARFVLSTSQADLKLFTCDVMFDASNWKTAQSVTMNPIYNTPGFLNSTLISINYSIGTQYCYKQTNKMIDAEGEWFNGCGGIYSGKRSVDTLQKAGVCTLTGDPHVGIFSENNYSPKLKKGQSMNVPVHSLGFFYAVQSNLGLTIQFNYGRCMVLTMERFQPSCIVGAYVQFKQDFISIDLKDNVNSKVPTMRNSTLNNLMKLVVTEGVYSITVKDSITGKDGTTIKISANTHNVTEKFANNTLKVYKTNYFASVITLSPIHYQQTQGHCNVYDFSNQVRSDNGHMLYSGDDLTTADFSDSSANAKTIIDWVQSFEVDANEVGFTQGPVNFARFGTCAASKQSLKRMFKRQESNTTYQSDSKNTNSDFSFDTDSFISLDDAFIECKACFGLGSEELEQMSYNDLMSCADDIIMAGSNMFCTSHAMLATSKLLTASTMNTQTNSTISVALKEFALKMDVTTCGSGVKVDGVCYCGQGYSGADCSVQIHSVMMVENGMMSTSASGRLNVGVSMMIALIAFMMF